MNSLPALTVWQPWATLIAEDCKPWEFRGRAAPFILRGKRIAIHAGARKVSVPEVRALLAKLYSDNWRETGLLRDQSIALLERVKREPRSLPLSSVLCTALLGESLQRDELAEALGFDISKDSDRHEHTMWGWPLTAIERLQPPMPASGKQGWWRVTV